MDDFLARLRRGGIGRVLVLYLGAAWLLLQVVGTVNDLVHLPAWIGPTAIALLVIGLPITVATAWVQGDPATPELEQAGEVPNDWELGLRELTQSVRLGRLPHLNWARVSFGGLVVFSLLFGVAGLYAVFRGGRGAPDLPGDVHGVGVAVMPFQVAGPEMELWRNGMVEVLSINLDGLGPIRGIDSRTVLDRWASRALDGGEPDPATVAREVGARYVVTGTGILSGTQVRLAATVREATGAGESETVRAAGPPDSIFALVDELTVGIARAILDREPPGSGTGRLAGRATSSPRALREYLLGEAYFRRSDFREAAERYGRAVEQDSGFALAHLRLAEVYGWGGGLNDDQALEALGRASAYRARLPEREALVLDLALDLQSGDIGDLSKLDDAKRRYPDDPSVWWAAAEFYVHFGAQLLIPREQVRAALERSARLSPTVGPVYIHLVEHLVVDGDSAEAVRALDREGATGVASTYYRGQRLAARLAFGDATEKGQVLRAIDTLDFQTLRGMTAALAHARFQWARARVRREMAERPEASSQDIAFAAIELAGAGQGAAAMREAERAGPLEPLATATVLAWPGGPLSPPGEVELPVPPPTGAIGGVGTFAIGLAAVSSRNRRSAMRAIELLRQGAIARDSAGDTLEAERLRGAARALAGAVLWQLDERLAPGIDSMRSGQRSAIGADSWVLVNILIRLMSAEALARAGLDREAERYYQSVVFSPYAWFRIAQLRERAGDPKSASSAYQWALAGWADAEEGFKLPQIARDRLVRLQREH